MPCYRCYRLDWQRHDITRKDSTNLKLAIDGEGLNWVLLRGVALVMNLLLAVGSVVVEVDLTMTREQSHSFPASAKVLAWILRRLSSARSCFYKFTLISD